MFILCFTLKHPTECSFDGFSITVQGETYEPRKRAAEWSNILAEGGIEG